jgi:enoyl-CoA hydratase
MAGAEGRPVVDETPGQAPRLDIDGRIATVTLRRPAVANRLEPQDLEALGALLADVDRRHDVLVLRLQGEGRHFCSGFNVGQVGADSAATGARFEALADAIERLRPVTVAVLQGGAHGGAVDLALACDFRVGGPGAEMRVPAARLGLHFYRGGLERMVQRAGLPAARRILLAAERLDAPTLHRMGLLDRLSDMSAGPDALPALADAFCGELAASAPLALLGMKKHLNRLARGALDGDELGRDIAAAAASADLQEGPRAWREKRAPRFEGR